MYSSILTYQIFIYIYIFCPVHSSRCKTSQFQVINFISTTFQLSYHSVVDISFHLLPTVYGLFLCLILKVTVLLGFECLWWVFEDTNNFKMIQKQPKIWCKVYCMYFWPAQMLKLGKWRMFVSHPLRFSSLSNDLMWTKWHKKNRVL